jgi:pyruvate/2-oxoglutarate dehydrogenase complex dihydrolipoamide dehydrogenase (E3) component
MERMRKLRAGISKHDSAARFSKELGIDVFLGRGKFTSHNTIEVNGTTLNFRKAVIATGNQSDFVETPIHMHLSTHRYTCTYTGTVDGTCTLHVRG